MPDRTPPIRRDAGSDSSDRLNAAIDRMLADRPNVTLNDPELRDLLQLAARLRAELPRDLPDPAFRRDLKHQLTTTSPVPLAISRHHAAAPARFPWVAAVSAIAAVMLAAISVGSLGIWLGDDSGNPTRVTEFASGSADQLTATTFGIATMTAESNPDDPAITLDSTMPGGPSSMTAIQPSDETPPPTEPTPATEPPSETTSTTTAPTTRTVETTSTSEPTEGPSLASVPPVDDQHVEQGPQPASDGGSGAPPSDVSYLLATELPDLDDDAEVYRLVPPSIDPETFVTNVAGIMGMQGEIVDDRVQGQTVYHLFDEEAGSFHWNPVTGAFSLYPMASGSGEPLTVERVIAATRDWLDGIGYPVDWLGTDFVVEPYDETSWRIDARYESMPDIGIGHPLGVTLYVLADGTITEATGYWLTLKQTDSAPLHSADAIWQVVRDGKGYWTGGGIVEAGGEFRADSMRITYILTRDPSGELVLQPVVQTTGEFTTPDGLSSARISCFVQAARTTDENTP